MDGDLTYYRRRIEEERSASRLAVSPGARAAHHELAELYAARVDLMSAPSPWQAPAAVRPLDGQHQRIFFA